MILKQKNVFSHVSLTHFLVLIYFLVLIFIYIYIYTHTHTHLFGCTAQSRDLSSSARDGSCEPLHWKCGVLPTGLPGKSLHYFKS